MWKEYSRASAVSCNYALVPSILIDPIMSAATIAFWADSGSLVRDTLDTCIVQVQKNGAFYAYTVDMQRGVIVSMTSSGNRGSAVHQYFYGYENGIYFLAKVTFGPDTSIQSYGGYEFINIRINGEQVTRVKGFRDEPRRQTRHQAGNEDRFTAGTAVSIYNLLGRRVASNGLVGRINQACRSGRCSSGNYLLRAEEQPATGSSAVISR